MTTYPADRAPATAQAWPPQPAPKATPPPPSSAVRRSGLQKTRDVALTVMAVLVSIVCAFAIYVAIAAGSALAEMGADPAPTGPSVRDCQAVIPPPDC
jgi:hypothetical protein